jgi:hypothetical protein
MMGGHRSCGKEWLNKVRETARNPYDLLAGIDKCGVVL